MKFLLFMLVCLFTISQPASAWGQKGHAAIARIAEANLTPAALTQIKILLNDDRDSHGNLSGRTTLEKIPSWPDEIRLTAPEYTYRGWHTRGNPVCSPKLGGCRKGECVDQKLLHYADALKDRNATTRERNEALKWVVHLVGDLHTPLHSGSNHDGTGKISVSMAGAKNHREVTLHSVWDHDLLNLALKDHPLTVTPSLSTALPPDAVMQWMLETREVSRKHVYDPLPDFTCGGNLSGPVRLDHAYQQQALPVIRLQIERAGMRLAQLLNELLQ